MKTQKSHSKFLSLVLRHKPDIIGLQISDDGWANIEEFIKKANKKGFSFSYRRIMFG